MDGLTAQISPGPTADLYGQALDAWQRGEVAAAGAQVDALLRVQPRSARALTLLGAILRSRGEQAAALDAVLSRVGQKVTATISLDVDDAAMVDRVSVRCACATCGGGCHDTVKQPAAAGVCDKCGGTTFARRADDTAETVRARLQAYHAQTAPLIAFCDRRGVLERIDAMGPIAEIRRALPTIVARNAA
jgi:adenylate kinase